MGTKIHTMLRCAKDEFGALDTIETSSDIVLDTACALWTIFGTGGVYVADSIWIGGEDGWVWDGEA